MKKKMLLVVLVVIGIIPLISPVVAADKVGVGDVKVETSCRSGSISRDARIDQINGRLAERGVSDEERQDLEREKSSLSRMSSRACVGGTTVAGTFQIITNILLFLVGAVAVIMLVVGGFKYVTSNGDQNAITSAKNTILYAIIGIVVAFMAFAAVNFVVGSLT